MEKCLVKKFVRKEDDKEIIDLSAIIICVLISVASVAAIVSGIVIAQKCRKK